MTTTSCALATKITPSLPHSREKAIAALLVHRWDSNLRTRWHAATQSGDHLNIQSGRSLASYSGFHEKLPWESRACGHHTHELMGFPGLQENKGQYVHQKILRHQSCGMFQVFVLRQHFFESHCDVWSLGSCNSDHQCKRIQSSMLPVVWSCIFTTIYSISFVVTFQERSL